MDKQKVYIGFLETPHFSFMSSGATKDQCERGMAKAWRVHCRQNSAPNNWNRWKDDFYIMEVVLGQAFRDYGVICQAPLTDNKQDVIMRKIGKG